MRARTNTHRKIYNTYSFPTAAMIRELASVLYYAYIACLVILCTHCLSCCSFPLSSLVNPLNTNIDLNYIWINLYRAVNTIHLGYNKINNVHITRHCGEFAWCLYLLGYPNSLVPFSHKNTILWRFNFVSTTIRTVVFTQSGRYFWPILTKFGIYSQLFLKDTNIKFYRLEPEVNAVSC
jgi:hypothetical protein